MTVIAVQDSSVAGVALTTTNTSTATDTFENDGSVILIIDAAATTLFTIDSARNCNQGFDHDVAYTCTVGLNAIGPFSVDRFGSTVSFVAGAAEPVVALRT